MYSKYLNQIVCLLLTLNTFSLTMFSISFLQYIYIYHTHIFIVRKTSSLNIFSPISYTNLCVCLLFLNYMIGERPNTYTKTGYCFKVYRNINR